MVENNELVLMWVNSFDALTVKKQNCACSVQITVIKVGKMETSIKESTKCNKY